MGKVKRRRKVIKVILTGGHAGATAYALIQELRESKSVSWDINWVGPAKALEGRKVPTFEKVVFPKIDIEFIPIIAGRVQRKFSFWTIPSLLKIPLSFTHALIILLKVKPKIIVSFGGYASFPVVFIGWLLGVPSLVHEQTSSFGMANRYSSHFATRIALGRAQSAKYFPRDKSVITGNPVSKEVRNLMPRKKIGNPPIIFVTGGSRGSEFINETINNILPRLLNKFRVIHQVGINGLSRFQNIRASLPTALREKYEVYGLVEPWNWTSLLSKADIVVSRAGANIVSEIMVVKIPSILIPIPWSYKNEQKENALYARGFGIAKILEQKNLTPENLYKEIDFMAKNWDYFVSKVGRKQSPDIFAATKLVELIKEYI